LFVITVVSGRCRVQIIASGSVQFIYRTNRRSTPFAPPYTAGITFGGDYNLQSKLYDSEWDTQVYKLAYPMLFIFPDTNSFFRDVTSPEPYYFTVGVEGFTQIRRTWYCMNIPIIEWLRYGNLNSGIDFISHISLLVYKIYQNHFNNARNLRILVWFVSR
jgi:hypothetical protein